jgi:hypothetical protein
MRSLKLVAVAGVALFAIAACGGSGGSAAPTGVTPTAASAGATATPGAGTPAPGGTAAAAGDPCKLLTVADLKTATGDDYGAGVNDGYGSCIWRVGGATTNNGDGQVTVGLVDGDVATMKSTFLGGVDLNVGGHTAYWAPTQGVQSIWVDLGGRLLVVSIDPVEADSQTVVLKLATVAFGNI